MTRTRNMSDLLDSGGDVKSGALDNVPASNDASALTTGTLPDGRFPATLPAASGANLTSLNPANLTGVTSTAAELNILDGVTATAAELNILDGVTATASELNILDGVTATASELNILDGVTATTAELNILDGVTATTAELNILDGVTATATELNYVDGVTSAIQTQIDNINTDLSNDTTPQLGGVLDTNGNNIEFPDSSGAEVNRLKFGAGDDLQIYHNGTDSRIASATGDLIISTAGTESIFLQDAGSNNLAQFNDNSDVKLYYNGNEKFATTSGGVDVTGSLYATANIGRDSTDYIAFTNNSQFDFYINGNNEFRFEADGDFHADGDVVAFSTTVSDERLKTDITKIDSAVDKVGQLNGYTFTYKADGKQSAGVIAQEVEKVLPSAVREKELPLKADDGVAYKTVQYDQLVGLLIEAVNELTARVQELERA